MDTDNVTLTTTDCCDGSDEYASGVRCPVTCAALMKTFQSEKADEVKAMEAGEADRKAIAAESAAAWQRDQDKKASIAASVASFKVMLEQQEAVRAHEEQIENDERVALLRADKHGAMDQLGLLELSREQLALIILEVTKGAQSHDELLALIKREREVAGEKLGAPLGKTQIEELEEAFQVRDDARRRETERIEKLREERRLAREERKRQLEAEAAAEGEDVPGVGADAAPIPSPTNSEPVSDEENDDDLQVPEVEERPVTLLFNELNAFKSHERPEAVKARERYQETNQKLVSEEGEERKLNAIIEQPYGADNIFYSLRDQCHETQSGEYTYSVCFYGEAKQSSTRLGAMAPVKAGDREIAFTNGDKCWNGPYRSLTVALECGPLPVELYAVDEPATCVYTAKLRTPVVCDQANRDRVLSPNSGVAPFKPHHVEVEVSATL